jgi:hypothetical protein
MIGEAALIATMILLSPTGVTAGNPPSCTVLQRQTTGCASASTGNGSVTVTVGKHKGGHKGNGSGARNGSGTDPDPNNNDGCATSNEFIDCITIIPPGAPGNPAVNIHDLKNFRPSPGTDHMQPNGWMIVGLSTNFYSVVGVQVKNGKLLGQQASVRFTPISWHWTYGDDKSATLPTKGNTWAALGIDDFDRTPTSHIYTKEKTYYIDLDITFSAEYRYAGGTWAPVVGTLTLPANELKITGGEAKTVLVGRDCSANPSGPGC